jgi:hypothetical protein
MASIKVKKGQSIGDAIREKANKVLNKRNSIAEKILRAYFSDYDDWSSGMKDDIISCMDEYANKCR